MSLPRLRPRVYPLVCLLVALTACSGGGNSTGTGTPSPGAVSTPPSATEAPPSTQQPSLPPADTPPPAPPPVLPPPSPAAVSFAGTYAGTWVSTMHPTAGGGVELVVSEGTTPHFVRFTDAPCYTISRLALTIAGHVVQGEIRFPTGGITGPTVMTLLGTLSDDGRCLTLTYIAGATECTPKDQGTVTLVQGPVTRSFIQTPVTLTETVMAALTSEVYRLTPADLFVPGATGAIETQFPTPTTFTQRLGTATAQGTLSYGPLASIVFRYVSGSLLPSGTMRGIEIGEIMLTAQQVEISGPIAVGQSTLLFFASVILEHKAQSQVVPARLRIRQDGTLVLINRGTGEEVATRVNVLIPGVAGITAP